MLESIEGKRGLPRHKPPYPAQVGLFGRPTLINNVETLFWVRDIVEKGPEWFASQGRRGRKGPRSFSVSGRVKEPGVKIAPAGITARELIDEYCGGMAEGHVFKGYLPGGASGGILPASHGRPAARFRHARAARLPHRLGRGGRAVGPGRHEGASRSTSSNSSRTRAAASARRAASAPRRRWRCWRAPHWDAPLIEELARVMTDASICGLGQAAMNPVKMVLKHFAGDVS